MIYKILLVIHILGGSLALLGGAVAIFSRKGNKTHRKGGKLFTYTMITTAVSAIILSLIKSNMFLLAIGFFTLYLTFSGWVMVMKIRHPLRVKLHYFIGSFGLVSGIFLLQKGLLGFTHTQVILLVFGGIQMMMSAGDLLRKPKPSKNIINHISKIGGAYIAAVTAFLVVNINFLPAYLVWLGPTVIGTVLISVAVRKRLRLAS